MRLIDADNVRDLFDAEFKETRKLILAGKTHLDNLAEGFAEADRVIWKMPTVDAVPVVRCKGCIHWDDDPDTYGSDYGPKGKCMKSFETMCADDFCSYGERKDEANES